MLCVAIRPVDRSCSVPCRRGAGEMTGTKSSQSLRRTTSRQQRKAMWRTSLACPTDRIATAMEAASVRPDSEFREEDRSTAPWHFIDICLQDRRIDVPARCPGGNCVTGKIDEFSRRLKEGNYDRWGAAGDLAFLIHFVGDIHQPLHAANDADRGGNCVLVDSQPPARNLHDAWDTTIVRRLEEERFRKPETTARKLEQTYAGEKALDAWIPGHTDDIAWESNQIARSDIYATLQIPIEPCDPPPLCSNEPECRSEFGLHGPRRCDRGPSARESRIQAGEPVESGFGLSPR